MTRQDILNNYDVDKDGAIRSPGKYEREMLYVPFFWEGSAPPDEYSGRDAEISHFRVNKDDRREFPELKGRRAVKLYCTEQGFVTEVI